MSNGDFSNTKARRNTDVVLTTEQTVAHNPFAATSNLGWGNKDRVLTTRVDLTREYVSAGYLGYQPYLRALLHEGDDLTQQFGIQVYENMMHDPEVASSVRMIKRAILSEQWSIEPSLPPEHPQYAFACAMRDLVKYSLDTLETDPLVVFNELLDGTWRGSVAAEMTYRLNDTGPYEGYLTLKDIKQKPTRSTVYVIDSFFNVVGVLTARYPGSVYPAGSLVSVPALPNGIIPGMLPRKKFIVFSWDVQNNDPRGQSILRPAYQAYWFKQQIFSEYLSWASKFASPSVVGTTAPNAVPQQLLDANGEAVLDGSGQPVMQTPEQVLAAALQEFRNGSAIAVPYGALVAAIETGNDGNAFAEALRVGNSEIVKAITMQLLATMEGKNQSRAASETHKDVLGLLLLYGKQLFANTVRRDCFAEIVKHNFGLHLEMYVPKLNLVHGTGFPPTAEEIAALQTSGYLDPSQYDALDSMLGLPPRKPGTVAPPPAPIKPGAGLDAAVGAAPQVGAPNAQLQNALQALKSHLRVMEN